MKREAIILCGGLSTRFRPYTNDKPKALVEISGKPIIRHQLEWLDNYNYHKVILAAGYKADVLTDYIYNDLLLNYKFKNIKTIEISTEPEPCGTGGAIRLAIKHTFADFVTIINGDNITDIDLDELNKHKRTTLTFWEDTYRFGVALMMPDGHIKFAEKPTFWINAGVVLVERDRVIPMLPEKGSIEKEVYPHIEFDAFYHKGKWVTFDKQRDKEEYEERICQQEIKS